MKHRTKNAVWLVGTLMVALASCDHTRTITVGDIVEWSPTYGKDYNKKFGQEPACKSNELVTGITREGPYHDILWVIIVPVPIDEHYYVNAICGTPTYAPNDPDIEHPVSVNIREEPYQYKGQPVKSLQSCPDNEVAVGVDVRSGDVVDSFSLRCASYKVKNSESGDLSLVRGESHALAAAILYKDGNGGGPAKFECPPNSAVKALSTQHTEYFNRLSIACAQLSP